MTAHLPSQIPWPRVKMRDVCTLHYGKALTSSKRRPGDIPVYGSNGVTGWHDTALSSGPTVILGRKGQGPLGVEWCDGPFWVIDTAYYTSVVPSLDPLFFYYFVDWMGLNHLKDGTSNPSLNRDTFGIQEMPLPPLGEQRSISQTLKALDDKIEVNRRMAATLEEMARALYRSWFVDFDPVTARAQGRAPAHMGETTAALFPARLTDAGLPEGWEMATIGEVAEIVGGSTPATKTPAYWEGGTHAWATPRDLAGLSDAFLIETSRCVTDEGLAKIGSGLSPAGSMLLSSRAPIGYRAIARVPVAVNQGFIVIRETARITGIEAYLWCEVNMDTILNNANGSTFQEISKKNFRPIPYLVADDAVRRAFDHHVRPMFDRMACLCEENRTLASLRDALLPKLMSGELRVREAERRVAEAV